MGTQPCTLQCGWRFHRRDWISHDRRDCSVGGRPRPAYTHREPGGVLVRVTLGRCGSGSRSLRPGIQKKPKQEIGRCKESIWHGGCRSTWVIPARSHGQGEAHGFGKTDLLLAYCDAVANSPITRCRPDTTRAMRLKSTLSGVSVARW